MKMMTKDQYNKACDVVRSTEQIHDDLLEPVINHPDVYTEFEKLSELAEDEDLIFAKLLLYIGVGEWQKRCFKVHIERYESYENN